MLGVDPVGAAWLSAAQPNWHSEMPRRQARTPAVSPNGRYGVFRRIAAVHYALTAGRRCETMRRPRQVWIPQFEIRPLATMRDRHPAVNSPIPETTLIRSR